MESDEEQKELVISFETIFDLLKREKDRADLQKLDPSFFNLLIEFMKENKKLLDDGSLDIEKRKNLERQTDNIKRLLIDFYGKREKKIIGLALDKSRTQSTIVDTSSFLKEEQEFFETMIDMFDNYRKGILFNILDGNSPFIEKKQVEMPKVEEKTVEEPKEEAPKVKLIRFINAVPKFVGEELEEYGPYEEEEIANVPTIIADLLISKGRAEEIKSNS